MGEVHGSQAPPSIRHSNVEPGSSALKVNAALSVAIVPVGPESICVSGAVSSPYVAVTSRRTGVRLVSAVVSTAWYCR